jgi:hypothetical protein
MCFNPSLLRRRKMPDEAKPASSGASDIIFATGHPPPGTAVAFADGVTNFAHSKSIVKFYLYRTDPSVDASGPYENNIVAQIVMPLDGFVRTALFLNRGIELLVSKGAMSQADVDQLRSELK